ncbi:MBL fold metallo-hydrolase [Planotetraspora phitsanulokensis]|uniref:MBL fold metallo-hydrolase n=1 Tax=Planotetraspora phitsanulokensis TaxID=575192 RepID=A0A8J3XCS0_9ACTN|nr:MBL fold metallo-hydrolase [Planotetraspora phitsanulokensis]GII35704.1 MBL fold metallo-hydrolase [Planotetraspora phitsanulokensis]
MTTLTHVGGPTVLMELDGWRILTDPTFDPAGWRYGFGWGTASVKQRGPALSAEDVGTVDVVLLSHDHHADNLDDLGRALLPGATAVVTTRPGARRLALPNARGLAPGETTRLTAPGRPPLTVTATPCRHGPPLSRPVAGAVVGFALAVGDRSGVAVWMTGDTVLHRPLRRVARTLDVDVLLLHLGSVRFPQTGPLRYSMDGRDAVELLALSRPRVAVPVHYEGWSHFSEAPDHLRDTLAADPRAGSLVHWLEPGIPTGL